MARSWSSAEGLAGGSIFRQGGGGVCRRERAACASLVTQRAVLLSGWVAGSPGARWLASGITAHRRTLGRASSSMVTGAVPTARAQPAAAPTKRAAQVQAERPTRLPAGRLPAAWLGIDPAWRGPCGRARRGALSPCAWPRAHVECSRGSSGRGRLRQPRRNSIRLRRELPRLRGSFHRSRHRRPRRGARRRSSRLHRGPASSRRAKSRPPPLVAMQRHVPRRDRLWLQPPAGVRRPARHPVRPTTGAAALPP